jgi:hypothetical protein
MATSSLNFNLNSSPVFTPSSGGTQTSTPVMNNGGQSTVGGFINTALAGNIGLPVAQAQTTPTSYGPTQPTKTTTPAPTVGTFSSAYAGLTPQQQSAYILANPNVDLATGLSKSPVMDSISQQHSALPSSAVSSNGFNVNTPSNVPSNYANSNTSTGDIMSYLNGQQTSLATGSNPSLYPTTSNSQGMTAAQQYYTQQLPAANQMTPDQVGTYQQYIQSQQQIQAQQYHAAQQISDLYSSGQMTKDQADQASQDIQHENDARLAQLTLAGQGATLNYNVMQMARQNNIAALTAQAPYYAPMQVTPGNSVVSPGSGTTMYQGAGASPQTIMSTAQGLAQIAVQNGSAQYNPDGSLNMQPYIQQAQQFYGSGAMGQQQSQPGGSTAPGGNNGSQNQPQGGSMGAVPAYTADGQATQVQYQGQPQGQSQGYGSNGYGNINALTPSLRQYVQNVSFQNADGSVTQLGFIDGNRLPAALQATAQSQSAAAGIPYFPGGGSGANAVLAAQQIIDVVNSAEALSIRNLKSGVGGKNADSALAWANQWLQFNPDLSNFNQLKDAASKATTALAGGVGSGFRMNMGIIEAATQNMPVAGDNLETAMTKAEALRGQIINALAPLYPQMRGGQVFSGNYTSSNPTGGAAGSSVDWANLQ